MVGAIVGILVTLIVAVLVYYNIALAIDTSSVDTNIKENVYGLTEVNDNDAANATWNATAPAANATDDNLDQAGTFFTIAPIIAIVVVAVVILNYVSKIGS